MCWQCRILNAEMLFFPPPLTILHNKRNGTQPLSSSGEEEFICGISKIVFWAYEAKQTTASSQISSMWKPLNSFVYLNSLYFRLLPPVGDMLPFLLSPAFTLLSLTAQIGFANLQLLVTSTIYLTVPQHTHRARNEPECPYDIKVPKRIVHFCCSTEPSLWCLRAPCLNASLLGLWCIEEELTQQMRTSGSNC